MTAAKAPPPEAAPAAPAPMSFTAMLEMDSFQVQDSYLRVWIVNTKTYVDQMILKCLAARQAKVPFTVPHSVLFIPPLEINNSAASGVSAFREVMHYDNLMLDVS